MKKIEFLCVYLQIVTIIKQSNLFAAIINIPEGELLKRFNV